uniref:Uncharacterized protein n=1 Tax=Rhizophora mucronata TaxID=61149 RepID=A0A2P2QXX5_RHIMU
MNKSTHPNNKNSTHAAMSLSSNGSSQPGGVEVISRYIKESIGLYCCLFPMQKRPLLHVKPLQAL